MSYFRATLNMQEYEKRLNNYGLGLSDNVLAGFSGEAALECFDLSQAFVAKNVFRTGFLMSTGKAEQVQGTTISRVIYDAPYAVPVHEGWTGRDGRFYRGRKYLHPFANIAFKNMVSKMQKFYSDLAAGLTTISAAPNPSLPVSGPGFVGSKSRGFRRATARRITSTGKLSYLYRGPKGRFTKVYYPGLGKSQKQAGRPVRIGQTP